MAPSKEEAFELEAAEEKHDVKTEYGEPREYDPTFKGPVTDRSCTDVICCILFFLCICGAAVCSIFGYARGDPQRLVFPTDTAGRFCGHGELKDKPFLFFFDLLQCARMGPGVVLGCPTHQVCVSQCPKTNFVYLESEAIEKAGDRTLARQQLICKDGVDPVASKLSIRELVKSEQCAAYYVSSKSVINRCIPAVFNEILNMKEEMKTKDNFTMETMFGDKVTGSKLENGTEYLAHFYKLKGYAELVFKDLCESWPHILVGLLVAMVVSLLWIVLLRWLVGVMVWLTLILFAGLFIFSSVYSYRRYYYLKSKNMTGEFGLSQAFVLNFEYYLTLKQTWLAFGCTSATLLLLFVVIVIVLAKRICIAIELIKEGSKAIGKMMLILFWPVFPFLLQIGVVTYWVTSALYIGSMGPKEYYRGNYTDIREVVAKGDVNALLRRIPCEPDNTTLGQLCEFVKFGGTRYSTAMQIYMLFMFFWLMNFVVALGQMTLAGAFASYYWAFNKDRDMPSLPVLSSLGRCFRYHLGSLAFGSLVIALVQLVRAFLEYLDRKLKSSENDVAKFILKCLKCCFWCLEKLLKFINKNAYIMIAIYGRSFCVATKDAFLLIMRNVLRTFVLDKVSDFIMFISKLMVTGAIAVASYYWFERSIPVLEDLVPDLHFRLVPVIILVLGTYLVSSCFFNVYDMAVDTLFLCFLEDLERNDGSPDKPYYMSKGLQRLLRKGNRVA
ncbi:choline transporter-like protein 2 [Babylonia areolata]|uniref:choline transporter-like protein 2 n=1 Tax=Babylonia areolata TaxID=304850 RepID=UPI003FD33F6B